MGAECHSTASVTSGSFLVNDKPPLNRGLCVRNSSSPSRLCFQGKLKGCSTFVLEVFPSPPPLWVLYLAGERVSGRGRTLRGGRRRRSGGGRRSSSKGTRVHAAVTPRRPSGGVAAGWGKNLRPGGTSPGSCGKNPNQEESEW
ncbi:hypothetical protein CHARACLAT_008283 [Characodon lateralis]|uniref:Uncharacterized protein n=1 Tax=Characodon lateralis TaxID=208331 RepID=A0ABU7DER6_9TELE|nr:hypothetical protein [Characodon lateralis]